MAPSSPPTLPPSTSASPCPDLSILSSESNSTRAAEGIPSQVAEAVASEFGSVEITLLDNLDMSARHQPGGWYRSPDGGLSLDGIYIKKIYPSGHGYPCPNPCPLGPPVRIGDIGELTSTGFTTLANLVDCQIPALRTELASLDLSEVWHEPNYFTEGQSITGGVTVQQIKRLPGSRVIQDITYHCRAPQGAILAVTSTAQLHTLVGDKIHRLRLWLCKYGMELLQSLEPGRTDPLYVVTGKVTSSSWANATYAEPENSLVLTHFLDDLPSYQWTEPGASRNWSKSSSTVINPQGERASDQCLFLRGFLLTPASENTTRQAKHALNIGDTIPDSRTSCKGHLNVDAAGGASGQGSSRFTHFPAPSSQSSGSGRGAGQHDLLIDEIPPTSSMDFYPSHQINKRLLELTLLSGPLEDISAAVAGNPGVTAASVNTHSDKHLHEGEGDQASSCEQGKFRAALSKIFGKRRRSPRSASSTSSNKTVHHYGLTPLFAIIIGINNYEDASLSKLSGSVPDAEAIKEYLTTDLRVPSNQIIVLCNKEASRANILDAFEKLKKDTRIQKDDPILIYYAGHGGQLTRETGDFIQVIFPQDYNPPEVKAIPDRKLTALLHELAETHGNNITVIFDCCHSGSGTHGDDKDATVRGAPLREEGIPHDNDPEMQAGTRGVEVAKGFAHRGIRSHVFLAACSANELAREDANVGRGRFTVALLKLLRTTGVEQLVYADVLCRIDPIIGQNPQCEGYHRSRAFFDAKVVSSSRTYYEVEVEEGKYILQAGSAHGVTKGAEFTIYKDQDAIVAEQSLAVMKVSELVSKNGIGNIQAFTTTLSPPPDLPKLPDGVAVAVQTKIGMAETFFLHVPLNERRLPLFNAVVDELEGTGSNPCYLTLVPREKAQMEMLFNEKGYTLAIFDPRLVDSGKSLVLPHTLAPNIDAAKLRRVLRAAAHYTFNLNHTQANNRIEKKIEIQFKRLHETPDEWDEDGLPLVTPDAVNLVRGDKIDFVPEEGGIYGFEIKNDTPWDLYFNCFYFDSMDLSIGALTPVANRGQFTQDFMLAGRGGTASIGYGPLAISPVSFEPVPQGLDVSAGFFKFYFSTKPLDLSHVPQATPFDDTRGTAQTPRSVPLTWDTVTLPVIQRRA
ncbi:caspase domain-containing protein [Coprinopsis sp. MPI-PUGE-AT-0042]|nr:caspase domain-containing protein [Coprinopsis sp. MPI-PUGE-AT-0042]